MMPRIILAILRAISHNDLLGVMNRDVSCANNSFSCLCAVLFAMLAALRRWVGLRMLIYHCLQQDHAGTDLAQTDVYGCADTSSLMDL